ncbi:MAG: rod shape-determining protein MreC, partial [Bacilli bacterium]
MKKINYNSKRKRSVVIIMVILIFLFFICSFLLLFERKYFMSEKLVKDTVLKITSFISESIYTKDDENKAFVNAKVKYLEYENNELRKSLNLDKENSNLVNAKVINHLSKTWYEKVGINKGKSNNIMINMPVINNNGLIGFVEKTSKTYSSVKLITMVNNKEISVIIQNKNNNIAGILSNYDSKNNLFIITEVVDKEKIELGTTVVTSGFNNEKYGGIYVGKVVKEE